MKQRLHLVINDRQGYDKALSEYIETLIRQQDGKLQTRQYAAESSHTQLIEAEIISVVRNE